MQDLSGRVALITGAASGIGLGIARACADAGMKLVLTDVDAAALSRANEEFSAQGHAVTVQVMDVSDEAGWRRTAAHAVQTFGEVHLLCNNAGITGSGRTIEELDPAEWRRIIDINLTGMFLGVQTLLPQMRSHGQGGHIVNTASMGALLPYAGGASYVASKAGMLVFSETLRAELQGSGIGVSVLLPAQVRTQLFATSAQLLAPQDADAMSRRESSRRSLQEDGLDPLQVGSQVLAAVRAGQFHIFTHPELRPVAAQRFETMLAAMTTD